MVKDVSECGHTRRLCGPDHQQVCSATQYGLHTSVLATLTYYLHLISSTLQVQLYATTHNQYSICCYLTLD